jgi:hypothetical protein
VNQRDARHVQRRCNARHRRSRTSCLCGHLLAIDRIPADRQIDTPTGLYDSPYQRHVFFFDFAIVELTRKLEVRAIVLGDDHQPRRSAIETMDDAGAQLAANAAEIVYLVEQRIDQRALRVAGGRMDDHACGLVDDDDVLVLIHNVEIVIFWLRRGADGVWDVDGNRISGAHDAIRRYGLAIDRDLAVFNQALNLRSRLSAEYARQIAIDADARIVGQDAQFVAIHVSH